MTFLNPELGPTHKITNEYGTESTTIIPIGIKI